eukprot:Sspe_Gene.16010::Locus_5618_Transcript_1_1_Confidence_1.000_Length_1421::g.16010::m.16010
MCLSLPCFTPPVPCVGESVCVVCGAMERRSLRCRSARCCWARAASFAKRSWRASLRASSSLSSMCLNMPRSLGSCSMVGWSIWRSLRRRSGSPMVCSMDSAGSMQARAAASSVEIWEARWRSRASRRWMCSFFHRRLCCAARCSTSRSTSRARFSRSFSSSIRMSSTLNVFTFSKVWASTARRCNSSSFSFSLSLHSRSSSLTSDSSSLSFSWSGSGTDPTASRCFFRSTASCFRSRFPSSQYLSASAVLGLVFGSCRGFRAGGSSSAPASSLSGRSVFTPLSRVSRGSFTFCCLWRRSLLASSSRRLVSALVEASCL